MAVKKSMGFFDSLWKDLTMDKKVSSKKTKKSKSKKSKKSKSKKSSRTRRNKRGG
jgi:hypothetical protein